MNGHFRYFTLTGHIAGAVQSDAIDATRKRRRRHFAASLQTVPLLSWLRSQLNLNSSGLIPTLNRIRPEEAMQREIEGAISMTKTIMVPGNPPVHQTLNTPINSIVAAAKPNSSDIPQMIETFGSRGETSVSPLRVGVRNAGPDGRAGYAGGLMRRCTWSTAVLT